LIGKRDHFVDTGVYNGWAELTGAGEVHNNKKLSDYQLCSSAGVKWR